mmetsp:Transcript_44314/g.119282  ORF Transcript_44314/g.119282 Transcript_44314/m.119282 type:complete len:233 (+) Transcript_44314:174-872(+)
MRERQDLVEGVLRGFRKNTRGELSMEDVCSIVGELGLFPNSPDLQRHVAQLIEEGDADGSGGWSLAELALLIQRVDERLGQLRRSSEDARAEEMSFSGEEVRRLRDAFDRHSADGEMSHEQAEHAVGLRLGLRLSQRSLAQHLEVVDPACGSLCFVKFMELVRSIQNSQGSPPATRRSSDAGHGSLGAEHDIGPGAASPRTAEEAAFEAEDAVQKRLVNFGDWAARAASSAA